MAQPQQIQPQKVLGSAETGCVGTHPPQQSSLINQSTHSLLGLYNLFTRLYKGPGLSSH
jgi:hypothetical protein